MGQRRDRTGELLEEPEGHDPRCAEGWLPDAADSRPVPCLVCRPHLTARRRRIDWLLGRSEWVPR